MLTHFNKTRYVIFPGNFLAKNVISRIEIRVSNRWSNERNFTRDRGHQWSTRPAHSPARQWLSLDFEVLGRTDGHYVWKSWSLPSGTVVGLVDQIKRVIYSFSTLTLNSALPRIGFNFYRKFDKIDRKLSFFLTQIFFRKFYITVNLIFDPPGPGRINDNYFYISRPYVHITSICDYVRSENQTH